MKPRIENNFKYHPPQGDQAKRYTLIRDKCRDLACLVDEICPDSREKSLAMTKLEEVCMWANASIARNEKSEVLPLAQSTSGEK